MKKASLSILTAFVFFVAMAVAQSSTGQDQGSSAGQGTGASPTTSSPSSQDQMGSPSGSSSTMGQSSGQSTGSSMGQESSGSMSHDKGMKGEKGEKTLKGCVASEGGQYMLQTKKGKDVMLSGSDVSAHVGHEVKVHGMFENGSSSAASSGAASSGKTFNVSSVDMVSDSCSMGKSSKGMKGDMKGGSSGASGSTTPPPQR